jgi:metal-responsive CopG/Arc/MetJ family transcriptional regulator
MKLFLHLELRPWQNSGYEKPLLSFASSLSSDVIGTEIDNQSEGSIVDVVIKLCNQVNQIFILIQAQPEESIGSTLKLLNHLLRNEQQIHTIVLSGNHDQVEKLLQTLDQRFKKEDDQEKIKEWIKDFALA